MATFYDYENRTAFDPHTQQGAPNATGSVYAKTDTTFSTPLTVVMMSSGLQAIELTSDQYSQLPGFQVEDHLQVVFKSGDFTKILNTTTPLVGPAGPAVSEAVDNGDNTVTFLLEDGSPAATVTLPASDVPGPPGDKGEPGDQGLPGVNAVPADEAVGTYATTPGTATHTALTATIVDEVDAKAVAKVGGKIRRDQLRSIPRASVPNPNDVRAIPASSYLAIPTPDGTGKAVHPDVLFVPEGWAGHQWWMAYTPYANSDSALENPCVAVSDDGITWTAPAGLTNPVEPKPSGGYNSDTELVLDHDGTLFLFWRSVIGADEIMFYRTSTDGVNWTSKVASLTTTGAVSSRGMLSPSITWDGAQWCLFYVDSTANPGPASIIKRTSPTLTGAWSAPITATMPLPNSRTGFIQQAWHIDVVWTDGYFHALVNTGRADTQGNGGMTLAFTVSVDGLTWTAASNPIMYHAGNETTWDNSPYRGCLVPLTDGRWRIYYSASSAASSWRIGVTDTYVGPYAANGRLLVGDIHNTAAPAAAIEARPTTDVPAFMGRRSPSGSTSDLMQLFDHSGALTRFKINWEGGAKVGGYSGAKAPGGGLGAFGHSEFQNNLFAATSGGSFFVGDANNGGGVGVVAIKNAATVPTTNSAVGGVLYSEGGALKWRGSNGTVTTIAPA